MAEVEFRPYCDIGYMVIFGSVFLSITTGLFNVWGLSAALALGVFAGLVQRRWPQVNAQPAFRVKLIMRAGGYTLLFFPLIVAASWAGYTLIPAGFDWLLS